MTTIAYRDGVLAVDGRISGEHTLYSDKEKKLSRLKDGSLVAYAGTVADCQKFLRWARKGDFAKPHPKGSYVCVWLRDEGLTEYTGNDGKHIVLNKKQFHAWGSGHLSALGAMHHGATAVEAVKCAAKVDLRTGGKISSATLKEK